MDDPKIDCEIVVSTMPISPRISMGDYSVALPWNTGSNDPHMWKRKVEITNDGVPIDFIALPYMIETNRAVYCAAYIELNGLSTEPIHTRSCTLITEDMEE